MRCSKEAAAVPPRPIRPDGSRFGGEVAEIERLLSAFKNSARVTFRNRHATEIVQHAVDRILVAAGPGSDRSTLFLNALRRGDLRRAGRDRSLE